MNTSPGVRAFIGLGSNLQNPLRQLRCALAVLKTLPDSRLVAHSRFYRSTPMGPQDQPDYINAVAGLQTQLTPQRLLSLLQEIEQSQGRTRGPQRWGPRTLDLDLLLYGGQIIETPSLTVPHPGIYQRNFVLYPLAELVGETFIIPGQGTLNSCLANCSEFGLDIVDDANMSKV